MSLVDWFNEAVSNGVLGWHDDLLKILGLKLRVDLSPGSSGYAMREQLIHHCQQSEDFFLDLVDCTLGSMDASQQWECSGELNSILETGASVWQVNAERTGLERRVSRELCVTVQDATSANDEAGNQLREAWSNAFGRNGDPSDAWDHAIKAVEALLCPVVTPQMDKPTLGHVLGELRANGGNSWRGSLPGRDKNYPIGPIVSSLEMLWPNPDRHGSKLQAPTEAEARSVVAVAAALIQAHRETPLVRKLP